MTMGQSPGSSLRSGNGEGWETTTPTKSQEPKRRPKTKELLLQIESLQAEVDHLNLEAREYRLCGWNMRAKRKLNALEYLFTTLVNLQCSCSADRERIDRLLDEVRHSMVPKESPPCQTKKLPTTMRSTRSPSK
jgi:hypothetical protein